MLVDTALESDLEPFQKLRRFELRSSAVCVVLHLVFITDSFLGAPSQFASASPTISFPPPSPSDHQHFLRMSASASDLHGVARAGPEYIISSNPPNLKTTFRLGDWICVFFPHETTPGLHRMWLPPTRQSNSSTPPSVAKQWHAAQSSAFIPSLRSSKSNQCGILHSVSGLPNAHPDLPVCRPSVAVPAGPLTFSIASSVCGYQVAVPGASSTHPVRSGVLRRWQSPKHFH